MIDQGGEVLKTIVPKMVFIWKELGLPPTESEDRLHAVLTHHKVTLYVSIQTLTSSKFELFQELWEAMLEVEKTNKRKILSTVDRLGRN